MERSNVHKIERKIRSKVSSPYNPAYAPKQTMDIPGFARGTIVGRSGIQLRWIQSAYRPDEAMPPA